MKRPASWQLRVAALAARRFPVLRAPDRGAGGHDAYFAAMSAALKHAGVAQPIVVIDRARLAANIAVVRRALAPTGLALRLAAKSLQAPQLLRAVVSGAGTERLMVFNGAMLDEIAGFRPIADVLLGRPLPVAQAEGFIRAHVSDDAIAARPQWLIDTPQRLAQYIELARARAATLRVSFEIDVGLHRGGFADQAALAAAIDQALAEPRVQISGMMGYDAQAAGAPSPSVEVGRSVARYERFLEVLTAKTGKRPAEFILNTAGSLTWRLHLNDRTANEVSIGSAFVKPAHYDTPTLTDLRPAVFLAQPVLKVMDPALVPGLESAAGAIEAADPNSARGFFLYGGYGDARVVSPRGLAWSRLWGGRSLLVGSRRVALAPDDFVFLRPTESEGVLTGFGDMAVFDGEAIGEFWPTFQPAA